VRRSADVLAALRAAGVPCGPVNDISAALRDPQIAARGTIIETQHEVFGSVRTVASPVRVGPPAPSHRRAPRRHEDAQDILIGLLGYEEARVVQLTRAGAFGAQSAAAGSEASKP
jgi:crotonobetainyl-CoA:carnitine CoA-transferase CaiB-like acyl-CoA transferase